MVGGAAGADRRQVQPATLVIYDGATRSGCGGAQAAMGPFYCPIDKKVYLDTSFFRDMKTKYGGGGDFAYAYVVAHEIGHHVQDLLGILDKVDDLQAAGEPDPGQRALGAGRAAGRLPRRRLGGQRQRRNGRSSSRATSRRRSRPRQAIGDDRLQTAARGYAVPDSFTHGSSAMRQKWLTAGLKSGDINSCAFASGGWP